MLDAKINRVTEQPLLIKLLLLGVLFIGLLGIGLYVNNVFKALRSPSLPEKVAISPGTLEEKYGLRVNLIAVTAAGGMVDVRLKIVDGEKAKLLLQDKKNFPVLLADDGNVTLNVAEDTKSQEIQFEDDGNLFLLFPNAGNAVKPGTAVTLLFGDIVVEQIDVR